MDRKQLEERIKKKQEQIIKIEKRIAKWQNAANEASYIKKDAPWYSPNPKLITTMDQLIDARVAQFGSSREDAIKFIMNSYNDYLSDCERELTYAKRDLEDAQNQLQKYNNELQLNTNRDQVTKIPVFVEFLENWKNDSRAYIEENMQTLIEYFNINSERIDLHNHHWYYIQSGQMTDDEWENKNDDIERRLKVLKANIHPWTREVYSRQENNHIDHKHLNEMLDKEANNKYWNMVNKVTAITGEITDASGLYIGGDGNINGVIIGENGKARLETIIAGGYNNDIIVNTRHGQIAHFRLLVHAIRG